VIHNF